MSEKKETTHVVIDKELLVYKRERSDIWQCRYCIDKKWQRNSTKDYELSKAKKKAKEIYLEAQFRKRNDIAPITRYFKDIAKTVVKKLKDDLASGNGKVIYKDYISAIEKYLIPALGKLAFPRFSRHVRMLTMNRRELHETNEIYSRVQNRGS